MTKLSAKVAIVTGCANGIGAATLQRLISDGANVIGTDVNAEAGSQLCKKFGAIFLEQNIADRMVWNEVVSTAVKKFGRLDILVNNAGMVSGASIGDGSDDDFFEAWDQVIAVNLSGTATGCRASIKAMCANPGGASGTIINIASTTAITPLPTDVGYSASKAGVRALTKSVATWCAKQNYAIRCNTVIPGATDTGILNNAEKKTPGLKAAVAATSPMNRLADPAETAAAISFLASDDCPFMTGADMLIDGGALSIHPGF